MKLIQDNVKQVTGVWLHVQQKLLLFVDVFHFQILWAGFITDCVMATHSSTLAWKIPWTEEPGRLQSVGLLRVRRDWATSLSLSCIGAGNGNPVQCPCLENPRDGGAWWAAVHGVAKSPTWLSDFPFTFMHWRRKWQPTPVFLPGKSHGWRSLVSCSPCGL